MANMAENNKSDGNHVTIDSVSEWETFRWTILTESLKEPALESRLFANLTLVVLYFCQHTLNLKKQIISMPFISSIFLIPNCFSYSGHHLNTIEPFT